VKRCRLRDNGH